ncbi:MAG TPA: hypothetical protein DCY35_00935 [Prolixibacteraceae bacterium]|nr:hypothetical protein [Prolixibacteraceae bacterium]
MKSEHDKKIKIKHGTIPTELVEFFSSGGKSLILRGAPGTGKTTLALEILDNFKSNHEVCFVSSRIDEQALRGHIKWIGSEALLSKGRADVDSVKIGILNRKELDRLESRVEEGDESLEGEMNPPPGSGQVEGNSWTTDVNALLPELDKLYDKLEVAGSGKVMVAIDSIDALAEKYGIAPKRLIHTLQKDLVERSRFNVIFILETGETNSLEYMGDGVVSLEMNRYEGRRLRTLNIEKLRGQCIHSHIQIFSLAEGHFNIFNNPVVECDSQLVICLKGIFGSLLKPGAYNLIEVSESVPLNVIHGLVRSIMEKVETRGIYSTNSPRLFGNPSCDIAAILKVVSPKQHLDKGICGKEVIPVDGEAFDVDFDARMISSHFKEPQHPLLFMMDANYIFTQYGSQAIVSLENHIINIIRNNDTCIGFVWPSDRLGGVDFGLTTNLMKLQSINSQVVLCKEKPYGPLSVLVTDIGTNHGEFRPIQ